MYSLPDSIIWGIGTCTSPTNPPGHYTTSSSPSPRLSPPADRFAEGPCGASGHPVTPLPARCCCCRCNGPRADVPPAADKVYVHSTLAVRPTHHVHAVRCSKAKLTACLLAHGCAMDARCTCRANCLLHSALAGRTLDNHICSALTLAARLTARPSGKTSCPPTTGNAHNPTVSADSIYRASILPVMSLLPLSDSVAPDAAT